MSSYEYGGYTHLYTACKYPLATNKWHMQVVKKLLKQEPKMFGKREKFQKST